MSHLPMGKEANGCGGPTRLGLGNRRRMNQAGLAKTLGLPTGKMKNLKFEK
jgi:hypothetical protein